MTGYHSADYAASLSEFGAPLPLHRSGGWLLKRAIAASEQCDAMSCYPLFTCDDWAKLPADLDALGNELVSVSMVLDPFSPLAVEEMQRCFDFARPFKEHFVIDAQEEFESHVSKHHRYYTRKALRVFRVEIASNPVLHLEEWIALYETLTRRHSLTGVRAFSRRAFAAQLAMPELVMFRACGTDGPVGAHLWIIQNGVAYSHLAAFNDVGYASGAAYALYWEAIRTVREQMSETVRWIDLGSGAGTTAGSDDGLTKFKRGWSSRSRTKVFCGRIFDQSAFAALCRERGITDIAYFPAYRFGEF